MTWKISLAGAALSMVTLWMSEDHLRAHLDPGQNPALRELRSEASQLERDTRRLSASIRQTARDRSDSASPLIPASPVIGDLAARLLRFSQALESHGRQTPDPDQISGLEAWHHARIAKDADQPRATREQALLAVFRANRGKSLHDDWHALARDFYAQTRDPTTKQNLMIPLCDDPSGRGVPITLDALHHASDPAMRASAAQALATWRDDEGVRRALRWIELHDSSPLVRARAEYALRTKTGDR